MSPSRPVVVVIAAVCLATLALVAPGWFGASGRGDEAPASPQRRSVGTAPSRHDADRVAVVRAATVLRRWDERRAAAYALGDMERLRALYAPGSRAGEADLRLLRSYVDRGLAVTGLRVQVVDLAVLHRSGGRIVLRVQDRVAAGEVVAVGERTERARLPRDRPTTRIVTLVRARGQWLVRSVREVRLS